MTDPRVDELRQRLRALGYLDGGVDRFVLAPARERRSAPAIAWLASLRIGLLAAVLLGPAAAIGVAIQVPGLVTGPRDGLVVALYFGVLLGGAVAVVAFGVTLALGALSGERVARRARPWSQAGGAFVAAVSLIYLTLWWRAAAAGAPGMWWTTLALATAIAISLLLGHAASVTALAVMMARSGTTPDSTASLRPASLAAAGVACAGLIALVLLTTGFDRQAPVERARLGVVPTGLRVRLLAIDGVDVQLFDDLAAAGRLPHLGPALSASRGRLTKEPTRDPARIWTTVATGQPPERHGVQELETRRVAGVRGTVASTRTSSVGDTLRAATDLLRLTRPSIASGTERREKTFWEVAADAGLRTAVINWWATWPASGSETDAAIVLSDRAVLRLERGGTLDGEIAPAALYDQLRGEWPALRDQAAARAADGLAPLTIDEAARAVVGRSAGLDAMQLVLAGRLQALDGRLDLTAIYLPGLDIVQHALLAAGERSASPSAVSARLAAVREYYVCLDRLLADVLVARTGELVMVVTEPGRADVPAEGLVGVSGEGARAQASVAGTSRDVMPTVLYALGVPMSQDLEGAPLQGLLSEPFVARHPVRTVASYGSRTARTTSQTGQALDQEAIDRLRSLGYLK